MWPGGGATGCAHKPWLMRGKLSGQREGIPLVPPLLLLPCCCCCPAAAAVALRSPGCALVRKLRSLAAARMSLMRPGSCWGEGRAGQGRVRPRARTKTGGRPGLGQGAGWGGRPVVAPRHHGSTAASRGGWGAQWRDRPGRRRRRAQAAGGLLWAAAHGQALVLLRAVQNQHFEESVGRTKC